MTFVRTATGIVKMSGPAWLYQLLSYAPLKGRRLQPEEVQTVATADMLRELSINGLLRATWTHVANEIAGGQGKASEMRYALAKAMGLIPGAGDFVFVGSRETGSGWIEMKRPEVRSAVRLKVISRAGTMSPDQKKFQQWCDSLGVRYAVCHTPLEVKAKLIEWEMLREPEST